MLRPDPNFEMELIFRSINVEQNVEITVPDLLKKGINWTKLITAAREHNVLPLLYSKLKTLDKSLLEPYDLLRMETYNRNNALHNIRMAQTLHWIIKLLSENDIEVIAFKGPALAIQAYGDLSLRSFADLDVLIHPEDFSRTCDVLTAAGLRSSIPLNKYTKKYWQRFHKNIEFTDNINVIDVHQQVTPGPKSFSFKEKSWQYQCQVDLLFSKIPVLSPEHSLLCLCVNGAQDGWRSFKIIADITHLITGHPGLKWMAVITDAQEIGCLRMLWVGLRLSQKISGVKLPEKIQKLVEKDQKSKSVSETFLRLLLYGKYNCTGKNGKTHKLNNILAFIRSMDSPRPGIRYLVYFTFSPTSLDWKTFKFPGFMYHVYFLLRPLRLLFKLISLLIHSLLKKRKKGINKTKKENKGEKVEI